MSTDSRAAIKAAAIASQLRALPRHDATSLRRVRRTVSGEIEADPPATVLNLAVDLLLTRAPGNHVVAYELVLHHPSALTTVGPADLARLGATIQSWGEVDTFACYVAGRAWRAGQIPDHVIADWAQSPSRWWRRAALVSTVPLNVRAQGGKGDAGRTLAVCELLVDDHDPMVIKAMSWALRELVVWDRRSVRAFLKRHDGRLARRIAREVRSKLDTGRKARKRPTEQSE